MSGVFQRSIRVMFGVWQNDFRDLTLCYSQFDADDALGQTTEVVRSRLSGINNAGLVTPVTSSSSAHSDQHIKTDHLINDFVI
jgi:hypothetical protein